MSHETPKENESPRDIAFDIKVLVQRLEDTHDANQPGGERPPTRAPLIRAIVLRLADYAHADITMPHGVTALLDDAALLIGGRHRQ